MSRTWFAVAMAVVALSASSTAQGPHSDTTKVFNGTSLTGWRPQGGAQWRVASGEIVGSATATPGTLVLDKSYQDAILRFAFQCAGCDAGVLLRNAPAPGGAPGTTSAIYVALSGPDAMTASRVTLDAQGKELNRQPFYEWSGRQNPTGMQLRVIDGGGGWKDVRLMVRANAGTMPPPGSGSNPATSSAPPGPDEPSRFGPPAFRLNAGDIRIKDVLLTDLLRPAAGVAPEVTAANFRRVQLTDRFYAEGVSAGDVNHDGIVDVASGPYAYIGPNFTRAIEIYPPQTYPIANQTMAGQYTDNFLSYVHDFDGDGWGDYLKVNFDGAFLYMNPKGESRHWPVTQVTDPISAETTQFADVDGDGKPELLLSMGSGPGRVVGYAKPGADPAQKWTFVAVSEKGDWGGHGYGVGDVNGDGRMDIIQGSGWWEQPAANAAQGGWKFSAVPFGRGTDPFVRGADMYAYDLNGDKLNDVITSLFAHGPGLVWYEQQRSPQGAISWKMHVIMDGPETPAAQRASWEISDKSIAFTELHAIELVDMDGDGLKDIVTGKRWLSHGLEYPENDRDDPPVVAWFRTVRRPGGAMSFVPQIINNYAGIGTQIEVADVNGDKRPDVLTAARKGVYAFLNLK